MQGHQSTTNVDLNQGLQPPNFSFLCGLEYLYIVLTLMRCHLCCIKMLPFSHQYNYFTVNNIFVLCPSPSEEVDTVLNAPTLLDHEFLAVIVHAIF